MRQRILEVLISSSVLILALALLRILLRGKISPRLQFGLWLLVAVRLLVPVSIGQSAASVMNYVPEQQMAAVLEEASQPPARSRSGSSAQNKIPPLREAG